MFSLFAQSSDGMGTLFGVVYLLVVLTVIVVSILGLWKMFEKAGKPGWAAIVPIYNVIILLEIADKPIWWILPMLIPIVNVVLSLFIALEVGRKFGQSDAFSVFMLWLFSALGYVILGFGDAKYKVSTTTTTTNQ